MQLHQPNYLITYIFHTSTLNKNFNLGQDVLSDVMYILLHIIRDLYTIL